ncbi:Hypothetical predicted protein [Podarcis lilfordi]|uniref:Cyclin-Y n=1 Tax=Podarcis lilfordi TaxID=74358 RepID=A0AA35PHC9_9SAUR|nr:Hypothetical predicted protein [Podarcis lilfordi]
MGNTTSCCVSSSPKLRRNAHSRLESYRPDTELSREDTGCNLQHISDRENIDDLNMEFNPSDHPRASTIFLSKSQTDVREKRKSLFINHHAPGQLRRKYSSCSTIFLDDSTVTQPNLKYTIKSVALAIYYHIRNSVQAIIPGVGPIHMLPQRQQQFSRTSGGGLSEPCQQTPEIAPGTLYPGL